MITDEDLPAIALIFLAGMALPLLVALAIHDVLALYLTGRQYTTLAVVAFTLVAWALLTASDLNRANFVAASLVFPWIFVVGVTAGGIAMGGESEGLQYVVFSVEDLGVYGVIYTIGGVGAVALQRGADRAFRKFEWNVEPLSVAVGVFGILLLGTLIVGGYATVAATGASISGVETVVFEDRVDADSGLVVDVEGDPTEFRLTVTAPDGTTATERLTDEKLRDGSTTIDFEPWRFTPGSSSLHAGTYEVELSAVTGVTVDSRTYTIETPPTPTLREAAVVPPGTDSDFDVRPGATVRETGSEDDYRIVTVVMNDGDAPGTFATRILTGEGEFVTVQDIVIDSGAEGVNVVGLSEEDVEAIQGETDGEVEVQVLFDGEVVTTESMTLSEPGEV